MTASGPTEPSEAPDDRATTGPPEAPTTTSSDPDPLRGSRTSGFWVAVIGLLVIIVLLAVFVLQNTRSVEITFLAWTGTAPLAAALLIATAAGLAVAAMAGSLRILQLRRRVKRTRRG